MHEWLWIQKDYICNQKSQTFLTIRKQIEIGHKNMELPFKNKFHQNIYQKHASQWCGRRRRRKKRGKNRRVETIKFHILYNVINSPHAQKRYYLFCAVEKEHDYFAKILLLF
jgi:hypothetical protein